MFRRPASLICGWVLLHNDAAVGRRVTAPPTVASRGHVRHGCRRPPAPSGLQPTDIAPLPVGVAIAQRSPMGCGPDSALRKPDASPSARSSCVATRNARCANPTTQLPRCERRVSARSRELRRTCNVLAQRSHDRLRGIGEFATRIDDRACDVERLTNDVNQLRPCHANFRTPPASDVTNRCTAARRQDSADRSSTFTNQSRRPSTPIGHLAAVKRFAASRVCMTFDDTHSTMTARWPSVRRRKHRSLTLLYINSTSNSIVTRTFTGLGHGVVAIACRQHRQMLDPAVWGRSCVSMVSAE